VANHPSALKRHRQSEKARLANRSVRAKLRTMVRQLREAIASGDKAAADGKLREATSQLQKAASKGVLHRRTADRQSGRLAKGVSALKV
jgi:small subunit ribosomal protein S20